MGVGERLREERTRLGMNQTQFAAVASVGKTTQINYESDARAPDTTYLAAIAKIGADVQYIVTGVRSAATLSQDESELLERYRSAPLVVKAAAVAALTAGSTAEKKAARREQVFHGNVGSVTKVEGNLDQRGLRISVGKKKK